MHMFTVCVKNVHSPVLVSPMNHTLDSLFLHLVDYLLVLTRTFKITSPAQKQSNNLPQYQWFSRLPYMGGSYEISDQQSNVIKFTYNQAIL